MIPITRDELGWVASEVGLPLIEDGPGGLGLNDAARVCCGRAKTARACLAAIVGAGLDDPDLLVAMAAEERSAHTVAGWRVLKTVEGETSRYVCVPAEMQLAAGVKRRAAMSDLAAGVSHELANALGAILGWTDLARRRSTLDPPTAHAIALIEASARAAHATARHMLEAARGPVVGDDGPVDASELVGEIAELLTPVAEESQVRIGCEKDDGLVVRAGRAQIFTIVWNLAQNAIEATPPGGAVDIEARRIDGIVRITIVDDGPGVPRELRERIFEPYYTTKKKGTGLGLALCRQAAEASHGKLELADEGGRGARFVLALPADGGGASSLFRRESGVVELADPRDAHILVVDDDQSMRELVKTALELLGARVTVASDGEEALAAAGPFDLALVDLGLDDVRGDALLAELRARGSVDTAALVSGASSPPIPHPGAQPDAWIRKPFELDDLLTSVRHLLGQRQRDGAASRTKGT